MPTEARLFRHGRDCGDAANQTAQGAVARQSAERAAFLHDVVAGLGAAHKSLDPKYFYDERGSHLFQQITTLPEYTITRTEVGIIDRLQRTARRRAAGCAHRG